MKTRYSFIASILLFSCSLSARTCANFYREQCLNKSVTPSTIYSGQSEYEKLRAEQINQILAKNPNLFSKYTTDYPNLFSKISQCQTPSSSTCQNAFVQILSKTEALIASPTRDYTEIAKKYYNGDRQTALDISSALTTGPGLELLMLTSADDNKRLEAVEKNRPDPAELSALFTEVKQYVSQAIEHLQIDSNAKKKLLAHIKSVNPTIDDSDCKTDDQNAVVDQAQFIQWKNTINICGKYVNRNTPRGSLFMILAHELGHSIDPCAIGFDQYTRSKKFGVGQAPSTEFNPPLSADYNYKQNDAASPYHNVLSCLRSENSVRARPAMKYNDPPEDSKPGEVAAVIVTSKLQVPKNNYVLLCGFKLLGFGIPQDSITESFADWIASEAEALRLQQDSKANAEADLKGLVSDLCNQAVDQTVKDSRMNRFEDPHPTRERRIQDIYLAQPKIRTALSCDDSTAPTYCSGANLKLPYPDFTSDYIPKGQFDLSVPTKSTTAQKTGVAK